MSVRERILRARDALLNGSGKLTYFKQRRITEETVRSAWIGYEPEVTFRDRKGGVYKGPAFTYPCVEKAGGALGIHYKSEARNDDGKRWQKWGDYADDLPRKGHGKRPGDPAKIIPWGMETLRNLQPASLVILTCGEEDALSLRQIGFTALSQPGAGLLEPVYAREFAELEVIVFYDAGEEPEARKDALTLQEAGARSVLVVEWPPDVPHGADVNAQLIENPDGFKRWAAGMIAGARPVSVISSPAYRAGEPDEYGDERNARNRKATIHTGKLLSEVVAERVGWLWRGRIPKGKLAVWEGDPGLGKSALTIDAIARVSVGRRWPDGAPCEEGGAVICSAEDGLADTIRPRLDAAGGDPSKVLALSTVKDGESERLLSIPGDTKVLRQAIERVDAQLLIVDPLVAFLSAEHSSHKDQDVRRALVPLAKIAEETGAAVVVVRHLNKASGGNPLYRGGWSIGIVGAARSAFLVAKHPEDENRRVLAPLKSNLAAPAPSLAFVLAEAANGAVRVEWQGETAHTADALLAAPVDPEERSALEEAKDYLRDALKGGPRWSITVKQEAREADISEMTLKRAKSALGVRSEKEADGKWSWRLPESEGDSGDQAPENDPLDPLDLLEPLPVTESLSVPQEEQGDQDAQADQPGNDDPLAVASNGHHQDKPCIHDVPGGCWLCKKSSSTDGE